MRRKYIIYSVMQCRHLVVITRIKAAGRRFKRFLIAVTTVLYSLLAWTEQCHNLITTSRQQGPTLTVIHPGGWKLSWFVVWSFCLLVGWKNPSVGRLVIDTYARPSRGGAAHCYKSPELGGVTKYRAVTERLYAEPHTWQQHRPGLPS